MFNLTSKNLWIRKDEEGKKFYDFKKNLKYFLNNVTCHW